MSDHSSPHAIEHQPNRSTTLSDADTEALLSELDSLLDDLVWTNPGGALKRWMDAWAKRRRGGSNAVFIAITRAIERRAEPLLDFRGSLYLSGYCDYDKDAGDGNATEENTRLVNVNTWEREEMINQCRLWQELYRERLPIYCKTVLTTGLFEEPPVSVTYEGVSSSCLVGIDHRSGTSSVCLANSWWCISLVCDRIRRVGHVCVHNRSRLFSRGSHYLCLGATTCLPARHR